MKKINLTDNKRLFSLIAILLVLCVTGIVAFASLRGMTDSQYNAFTPAPNVQAQLTEPNWKPTDGIKVVPGQTLNKDPMITNVSKVDEYVAVRLTFLKQDKSKISDADLKKLLNLIEIDWSEQWELKSGTLAIDQNGAVTEVKQPLVFCYKDVLTSGNVTKPVFSKFRMKDVDDGLQESDLLWLQGIKYEDGKAVSNPDGIGRFNIQIDGAAVQASAFENGQEATESLLQLFP